MGAVFGRAISAGVQGPTSVTDEALAVFDGSSGKKIKSNPGTIAPLFAGLVLGEDATISVTNGPSLSFSSDASTPANRKLTASGGAFLWEGSIGEVPVGGAGTRMMWIPEKGAFRAGYAAGTAWDDANIGNYSTAFGYSPTVSGSYSSSFGTYNIVSGSRSSSFGGDNSVASDYSVAFGNGCLITLSPYSIAAGYSVSIEGAINKPGNVAFGYETVNDAAYSIVAGYRTKASGYTFGAMVVGYASKGNDSDTKAIYAEGNGNFAQGYAYSYYSTVTSDQAHIHAIGEGAFAQGKAYSKKASDGGAGIISSAEGSFAQGKAYNYNEDGYFFYLQATEDGAFAQGYAKENNITASNYGAFARGYALTGDIIASGQNSMAIGDDVSATAEDSIVFGLSCANATASSMRVGWSANGGIHIKNQELWFGDADAVYEFDIGTTNGLRIGKTASQMLGFFGATPVSQRLKADYNGWAVLSDVVNALVSLGLFDQA